MTLDQPLVVSEPPRSTSPTWRVSIPLPAVAAVLGAIPFAMHAWSALHGYFWQDDFVIAFRAAHGNPVDPGYLFRAYNGEHIAPGMFLLAWLVTAIAPLNFPVAVVPLLLMQALATVLFWRLLVRCFGARWAILPLFAVFAWSPLILVPSLWWAFGAQFIPGLLAMIGALHALVRHLQDRKPAWPVLLWLVAGLAFYEKATLIPVLLVAVAAFVERASLLAVLRGFRWLWLGCVAIVAGYGVAYLAITSTASNRDTGAFGELARRLIAETFVPGILGLPPDAAGPGLTWVPAPTRAVAWLAALVIIGAGVLLSGRRAVFAWLLLAGYLGVDLVLTRLRLVGPLIGADPRYVADAVPVAVLLAGFALLGPPVRARVVPVIAAVLTVVFMVGATVSYYRLAPAAQARKAHDYLNNAAAVGPDTILFDGNVPDDVMLSWFGPDARQSQVLSLLPGERKFDEPTEQLYRLDDTGRPRQIEKLTGEIAPPGPSPQCGYAVTEKATDIPLVNPVRGKLIARLGYYTSASGDAVIKLGDTELRVPLESGLHVLYIPVAGEFGSIELRRATPVSGVCLTDVAVGVPVG
jgi:hypothetical protein